MSHETSHKNVTFAEKSATKHEVNKKISARSKNRVFIEKQHERVQAADSSKLLKRTPKPILIGNPRHQFIVTSRYNNMPNSKIELALAIFLEPATASTPELAPLFPSSLWFRKPILDK
jgi:hypothetical protein